MSHILIFTPNFCSAIRKPFYNVISLKVKVLNLRVARNTWAIRSFQELEAVWVLKTFKYVGWEVESAWIRTTRSFEFFYIPLRCGYTIRSFNINIIILSFVYRKFYRFLWIAIKNIFNLLELCWIRMWLKPRHAWVTRESPRVNPRENLRGKKRQNMRETPRDNTR